MKSCLGSSLLILLALTAQGAEQQPEFPGSADAPSTLLEKRLSLAGVRANPSPVDELQSVLEFARFSGATDARIEYLLSSVHEGDWVLKSPGEIQLYPPQEDKQFWLFGTGCVLINR